MQENTSQKNSYSLKEWYENLPAKDQTAKRDLIVEGCGIHIKTFYSWLNGAHIPKLPMQNVIKSVAKTDIKFTHNAELMAENLPLVK